MAVTSQTIGAITRPDRAADGAAAARRLALLAAVVAAVSAALWLGKPTPHIAADADLARLLFGMGLIKGMLAAAAAAVVYWRLGLTIGPRLAVLYIAGVALAAGAAAMVAQLAWIGPAALAFHFGELGLLALAWTDRRTEWRPAAD